MGTINEKFAKAFREHSVSGVASSGAHEPTKVEIRAIAPVIEAQIAAAALAGGDLEAAAELIERLHATVEEAAAVLAGVTAARLSERITVQKYEISVLEAVYHVVEHFAMHTGQIIFATKMLTGADLGFYKHLRSAAAHNEKTP